MDWSKLPVLRQHGIALDSWRAPVPGGIVPCLLCTKPFIMGVFIGEPDQICPECYHTFNDTARVVCSNCRPPVTICRLVPKMLDNGFYIRPRSTLHVDACNVCRPGINESVILEITEWEKTRTPKTIIIKG